MPLTPGVRKLALTAHVLSSVGWFGSVAVFLALALVGLSGRDAQVVRAVYVAMELITWLVIVPACFATLLTGFVQSLGTVWGLFRHYWVVAKLLLTVAGTLLLLLHTHPIGLVAAAAADGTLASGDLHDIRVQLVFDAAAALVVLLAAALLSVYKPRGLTSYGWRRQQEERRLAAGAGRRV